jgi:hypothetical protein
MLSSVNAFGAGVVVVHFAGEGDHGAQAGVAGVVDVLVDGELVPDGFLAGAGDHHGLGLAVEAPGDVGAEVLHDHLDLLADVVRVQLHPVHQDFSASDFSTWVSSES